MNDHSALTKKTDAGTTQLRLLGGFELCNSAGQPIDLKARKSRLLLAYLAVPSGQTRTRDQLASLLWSDRQDEQARSSLRSALSGIRRAIGDDALLVEQDTVSLSPGFLTTDYDRIKPGNTEDLRIEKLSDFYAGAFLAGHEYDGEQFMDWLRSLRAECSDMAISVLENNAARLAGAKQYQPAISLMRECLTLEPLKEQTHRTIMQLYAASGERAMAMAQYRTCKELLQHELDTDPAPETQTLADTIALENPDASDELHRQATSLRLSAHLPADQPARTNDTRDQPPTIAILPFVNMSGDAEQNYFADGMTEDIITDLSGVDALSVAAKSASQMYRGASVAPAQISAELGVRYILEGSVRKAGNNIRISAQLNDARTGLQMWAERYDRELDNIFQLQSEISQAIVDALRLNLIATVGNATVNRTTDSVEAHQYYLRGQVSLQEHTKRGIELAYDLFNQAITIDPDYALAHTAIARCTGSLCLHYDAERSMLVKALEHCNTALKLHPELAEAYSARGYILLFEKKLDLAYDDMYMALSLDPHSAITHHSMAHYHLNTEGGVVEACAAYKRCFEISQNSQDGMMWTMCLRDMNRPEELRAAARRVLKVSQRRFSANPLDCNAPHHIAGAFYDLGQMEDARHWLRIAASFDIEDGALVYNLACLHSVMGYVDETLSLLEKTLTLGCNELKVRFMKYTDPDLNNVREDPRFEKLLAKYGFNFRTRKPHRDKLSPKSDAAKPG